MRIGIFGGTFNPPHLGHRHIVEDFHAQMARIGLPLDKLLIIPTYVPPHKAAPDLASGEDRLLMCNLQLENGPFEVSDIEIKREGASYTWMTLEALHEQYDAPGEPAELYFLMGDDMLLYLPHWVRPEKILEDAVLVSTIRSHECSVEELKAFAQTTYPDQYAAGRFLFFESEPFPVSSTEIRALVKLAAGIRPDGEADAEAPAKVSQHERHIAEKRLEELLDPNVLQYILERELYQ
ncbi:MAG: nicotinate (nicotinamide) nucleotide adenylyltransferase [Clostridia bacterium]|nr:nicotinate (nicotinamide) nucleotide adenylyltransferase [Clostridia bacterium]MBP5459688.1 nicotinate (nicotinamide) nucleotide adenylyltransferase [Clostridia bacterium]